MSLAEATPQIFWLGSRAVGIVAIALLGISVALGLMMSTRLLRLSTLPPGLRRLHEATALVTLAMVGAHAGLLLADGYLRPGLLGVLLPFQLAYQPLWTGVGIIAAWLAAILGLSFYLRRWIGPKTWRWLHRWTLAVYVLAIGHAIGAGTDGRAGWMFAMLSLLSLPIVFAFAYRMLPVAPADRSIGAVGSVKRPAPAHSR